MFRKLAMAAAFATTAGAAPAFAEVVERRQINQWTLEANYGNGALQNCSIKASYRDPTLSNIGHFVQSQFGA